MCYENDGTFFPSEFDNGISACDAYFATASPSLVPVVSSYLGFCTVNQGAVETGSMSPAASSTAAPSIASSKLVLSTSKAQATVTGSTTTATQGNAISPTSSISSNTSKNSSSRLTMPVAAVSHQFVDIPYSDFEVPITKSCQDSDWIFPPDCTSSAFPILSYCGVRM
jgi:hypothetical protein